METLFDDAQDRFGNTLPGASITVKTFPQGVLATLYADPLGTVPMSNPFVAMDGTFQFSAVNGTYQILTSAQGVSTTVKYCTFYDPLNDANYQNFLSIFASPTFIQRATVVASTAQTVVTVPFQFVPGNNSLQVFRNGSYQDPNGAIYNETSNTSVTFLSPLSNGDNIEFVSFNTVTTNALAANNISLADSAGFYTTKTAEAALQQIGFQILESVITPEKAGATGASAAADTAAWQTILADPRRIECYPGRVYQIQSGLTASVRKRIMMNGSTLKAVGPFTHLFTNAVNQLVMLDGTLDGNKMVTDCLTFAGGGNSVFEAMTFKNSLRDTVWFGVTGVNDQVLFNTCIATLAGTTYTALTATTTAGSATVTLSGTPNALVRIGDFIVITGAGGGYTPGNIHVITGISGATLTVDNSIAALLPANNVAGAACSIYSGSAWHFTHSTDANLGILMNCNSSNTAACGAQDESLYGHRNYNTDHQAALIGTSVGCLGSATTSNTYLAPPYYEQASLTLALLYQQGNNLKIDSAVLPTMSKYAYTPGNVFALSWQWQDGNNSLTRNYQEYVNATTITLTDEQDMSFVQSGGAGNVTIKLPDAPYFADRPQVFNCRFAVVSGKTFTFTSTASNATLVNGVAGLTGVAFTPANYSRLTATWTKNLNGWVVA